MTVHIDGDLLVYSLGYACETKDDFTGEIVPIVSREMLLERIDNKLQEIVDRTQQTTAKVYISGSHTFRHDYATIRPYKGHRDQSKRPIYYGAIRSYLLSLDISEAVPDGWEADDAMGTNYDPAADVIASYDKDMKTKPGWHYDWRDGGSMMYVSQLEAHRNYYKQVVEGDKADNIPSLYHLVELNNSIKRTNLFKRAGYKQRMFNFIDRSYSPDVMERYVRKVCAKYNVPLWQLEETKFLLHIRDVNDLEV